MSGVEELADLLRVVRSKLAIAKQHAQVAEQRLTEGAQAIGQAVTGSSDTDVLQVAGAYHQVLGDVSSLRGHLSDLDSKLVSYLGGNVGAAVSPPPPAPAAPAPIPQAAQPAPENRDIEPPHIRELRATLPPPVQPGARRKTHGQWMPAGQTAATPIVSGEDELSEAARQHFVETGARRMPVTVTHVETKLAVHMRRNGITDASVVINHIPCRGPLGCDELLSAILPEGSSLTVHGTATDGTRRYKRYIGGAK